MEPAWSADGKTLYFDSNRTGITNIYAYVTLQRIVRRGRSPTCSAARSRRTRPPDGKRIAVRIRGSGGVASISTSCRSIAARGCRRASTSTTSRRPSRSSTPKRRFRRRARIARSRRSRRRPGSVRLHTSADTLSIQTGGTDAVRAAHLRAPAVGLDLDRGDTNVGASYNYSGFRPQLGISGARTLVDRGGFKIDGVNKTYLEEDWSGTLSLGIPFESRPSSSWSLSFDYDVDWFRLAQGPSPCLRIRTSACRSCR